MEEITFEYYEEHFDEIMSRLETEDQGYLIIMPDGNRFVLVPYKNKIIERMERNGLIENIENALE
jgi:hypothetical protein